MAIIRRLLVRAAVLALSGSITAGMAFGQATIDDNTANAAQIATRLQGPGVTISGANIPAGNGSDATTMYGLFSNGVAGASLDINSGAALSTGSISEMFTSNSAAQSSIGGTTQYNDPDLTSIEPGATRNVAVITMNVTLDSDVVGLQINYQFGSDEYPDYTGSNFNDLFAILISGPGISGQENIAILPSGDRTDINSVNYGIRGCNGAGGTLITSNNPSYRRNGHVTTVNGGTGNLDCNPAAQPGPFPLTMEWNGYTTKLTARRTGLVPGATYQLKIAVADVLDAAYDSGAVFEVISGVFSRDFGDAPNTGGYGDPFHNTSASVYLGQPPTVEANGYNSPTASADVDDGVTLSALSGGNMSTMTVRAIGTGGYLQAWFDWNTDGDFDDSGEQVAADLQDTDLDGFVTVTVTPPPTGVAYDTFARYRWSTQPGLTATANAPDGEVEDYLVTVSPASMAYMCPAGMTPISQSGNAAAVLSTPPGATNPNNALGPFMPAGSGLGFGNAAHITASATTLGLDLGQIVPHNAPITLSLARDDLAGQVAIDTSLDAATWSQQLTFNGGVNDISQRVTLVVPSGSARYLRFRNLAGNVWVDGVQYTNVCLGVPELQASKSVVVYDPATSGIYALPGNDVIYAITVANTGSLATDPDTVVLIDEVPDEVTVFTGPTPEFGGQAADFAQTGASLTFNPVSDLRWSDSVTRPANFTACTYAPVTDYDPAITHVCINPKGVMAAGTPDPNFTVRFRARIR